MREAEEGAFERLIARCMTLHEVTRSYPRSSQRASTTVRPLAETPPLTRATLPAEASSTAATTALAARSHARVLGITCICTVGPQAEPAKYVMTMSSTVIRCSIAFDRRLFVAEALAPQIEVNPILCR